MGVCKGCVKVEPTDGLEIAVSLEIETYSPPATPPPTSDGPGVLTVDFEAWAVANFAEVRGGWTDMDFTSKQRDQILAMVNSGVFDAGLQAQRLLKVFHALPERPIEVVK